MAARPVEVPILFLISVTSVTSVTYAQRFTGLSAVRKPVDIYKFQRTECRLLKYFLNNQNKILTQKQIYQQVWNDTLIDDNTIMVHIRRLRLKIEDDPNHPVFLKTSAGLIISL